jgi:GDP-4-dehydro-6-deoxy-D-mannose reductase
VSVLITGAQGGVAQTLIHFIKKEFFGEEVLLLTRTEQKDCIPCDLTDIEKVKSVFVESKPRLIFHFAGSATNRLEIDYSNNVIATKNIYDVILELKMSTRIFIMGSAAEYGFVKGNENPIREDSVTRPVSIYGMTKLFQTQLSQYYFHTYGLDIVVGRLFNLVSKHLSDQLFVGRVYQQIESYKKGEIPIMSFGNLKSQRDYIEGEEMAKLVLLIAKKGLGGEVYNIASGKPVSMENLLKQILIESGLNITEGLYKEDPIRFRLKYHDIPTIYADISKVQTLLEGVS